MSDSNSLPKLPKLPKLPEFPKLSEYQNHSLPKFPPSEIGEKLSREAIKNSISNSIIPELELEELEEPPELPLKSRVASTGQEEKTSKLKPIQPAKKHVFVKISNFKAAIKQFNDIKEKIVEIEGLLGEINNIKKREEFELEEWKQEINSIKEKMNKINENLFSKIE